MCVRQIAWSCTTAAHKRLLRSTAHTTDGWCTPASAHVVVLQHVAGEAEVRGEGALGRLTLLLLRRALLLLRLDLQSRRQRHAPDSVKTSQRLGQASRPTRPTSERAVTVGGHTDLVRVLEQLLEHRAALALLLRVTHRCGHDTMPNHSTSTEAHLGKIKSHNTARPTHAVGRNTQARSS